MGAGQGGVLRLARLLWLIALVAPCFGQDLKFCPNNSPAGCTFTGPVTISNTLTTPDLITSSTPVVDVRSCSGADVFAQANSCISTKLPTRSYGGGTFSYGTILIPYGVYSAATTLSISSPFVKVQCIPGTIINWTDTTSIDAVRVKLNPFPNRSDFHAQGIEGCDLYGNATSTGGLVHMGDVVGFHLKNVFIGNNTAGSGLWFDNTIDWTERTELENVTLHNNAINWRFTQNGGTNSFGYTRALDVRMLVNAGQTGLSLESGFLYNSILNVQSNVGNASGIVIHTLTGFTAQDNAYNIQAECTSCTGASLLTVETGGTFNGNGLVMGLNGSMGVTINGTGVAHIASPMMPNNDLYRTEWSTDNGLVTYFNNAAKEKGFSNNHRLDSALVFGWSSGSVTGTALDTALSRVAADELACGNGTASDKSCQLDATILQIQATAFASLGTPANGTLKFCNDCTVANPCAGAGTGALAKRLNGAWVCN